MPTIGNRFGGALYGANLVNHLEVGIPANLEVVMEVVCGRRLGVAFFFPKLGLCPRGWKKDQFLERCLVWWGGSVC